MPIVLAQPASHALQMKSSLVDCLQRGLLLCSPQPWQRLYDCLSSQSGCLALAGVFLWILGKRTGIYRTAERLKAWACGTSLQYLLGTTAFRQVSGLCRKWSSSGPIEVKTPIITPRCVSAFGHIFGVQEHVGVNIITVPSSQAAFMCSTVLLEKQISVNSL
jgi:hypothetical protein